MSRWVVVAAAIVLLPSCHTSKTYEFKDTEGRTFSATCPEAYSGGGRHGEYDCQYHATSTTPAHPAGHGEPDAKPGFAFESQSRYLAICDAWVTIHEKDHSSGDLHGGVPCRIVACHADDDCPGASPMLKPTCLNGLCGNAAKPVDMWDVNKLCQMGKVVTGAPGDYPKVAGEGGACGPTGEGPCTVPPTCHQP